MMSWPMGWPAAVVVRVRWRAEGSTSAAASPPLAVRSWWTWWSRLPMRTVPTPTSTAAAAARAAA
jgi:hypothetical protein